MIIKCLNLFVLVGLVGPLFLSHSSVGSGAPHKDEFTRLLGQALRSDKTRFQYEVNLFEGAAFRSVFIDEAYSRSSRCGRTMMNHGAMLDRRANSMYFWSLDEQHHEAHWLRPFNCSTSRADLNSGPIKSGPLFDSMPPTIRDLFIYHSLNESDMSLHGLGALLLNVFEGNNELSERITKSSLHQELVSWTLPAGNHRIEVSISKPFSSADIRIQHLEGITVCISRSSDGNPTQLVSFFTALSFSQNFDDSLVHLPIGYSCSRSIRPDTEGINARLTSTPRTKYTYEVAVTRGTQIPNHASRILADHYSDYVPQPSDTMAKPETEAKTFELLHDQLENIIAVLSSRSKSSSLFRSTKKVDSSAPSLSIWDLQSRKQQVLDLETGKCEKARTFATSLAGGQQVTKMPSTFKTACSFEGVEISLDSRLTMRLNEDGLKLLTASFQDRSNFMQLIDVRDTPSGTELAYEQAIHQKFCLIDMHLGFIQLQATRLVTRYLYKPKEKVMVPKSSSLLYFDTSLTQLMLQVDFNLLHLVPYDPWSSSRHMLDLSGCKSGYKESARLRIEYALTTDSEHLKDLLSPHKAIRSALAANLRLAFGVSQLRIPSIEVDIREGLLQVELHLLERASLMSESTLMETLSATSSDKFVDQLDKATRSIIVDSVVMCSEYCEQYQCEMFAYCNYARECYIYTDPNVLAGDAFGSYKSLSLNCDAYKVSEERKNSANEWRKRSWSLEDILEYLTESINEPGKSEPSPHDPIETSRLSTLTGSEATISFVATMNSEGARLSRQIRLTPSYAEYAYDNLHSSAAADMVRLNPFSLVSPEQTDGDPLSVELRPPHEMANNFKILITGHRFVDSSAIQIHSQAHAGDQYEDWQAINLESARGGFLTLENQKLDDCLRACLNDPDCRSLSFCSSNQNPSCVLTSLDSASVHSLAASGGVDQATSLRVEKEPVCTLMQRTFADQFYQMELRMLLAHGDRSISDAIKVVKAASVDQCASECVSNRASGLNRSEQDTCLSFDFCQPIRAERGNSYSSACILFKQHLVASMPTRVKGDHGLTSSEVHESIGNGLSLMELLQSDEFNVSANSYCAHHGRNYMADFHRISRRRLPDRSRTMTLRNFIPNKSTTIDGYGEGANSDSTSELMDSSEIEEDVSLARCANLCEEDPGCGAFEYCIAKHGDAPNSLYLSCSIAIESSFEVLPVGDKLEHVTGGSLAPSQVCSTYVYKRLSLVMSHRRNFASVAPKSMDDSERIDRKLGWKLHQINATLLIVFYLVGWIISDPKVRRCVLMRPRGTSADTDKLLDEAGEHSASGNQISLEVIKRES